MCCIGVLAVEQPATDSTNTQLSNVDTTDSSVAEANKFIPEEKADINALETLTDFNRDHTDEMNDNTENNDDTELDVDYDGRGGYGYGRYGM